MRYAEELAIINATGSAKVQHIKRESFVLPFDLGRQKGSRLRNGKTCLSKGMSGLV
jgi:hypothetical protein